MAPPCMSDGPPNCCKTDEVVRARFHSVVGVLVAMLELLFLWERIRGKQRCRMVIPSPVCNLLAISVVFCCAKPVTTTFMIIVVVENHITCFF